MGCESRLPQNGVDCNQDGSFHDEETIERIGLWKSSDDSQTSLINCCTVLSLCRCLSLCLSRLWCLLLLSRSRCFSFRFLRFSRSRSLQWKEEMTLKPKTAMPKGQGNHPCPRCADFKDSDLFCSLLESSDKLEHYPTTTCVHELNPSSPTMRREGEQNGLILWPNSSSNLGILQGFDGNAHTYLATSEYKSNH